MQIHILAIDKNMCHKKQKICFGWNSEQSDSKKDIDVFKRFPEYEFAYKAIDDNEERICDVCLWFYEPYCSPSSIVHDQHTVSSFSSSLYNITNMLKGKVNNLYNQEYGPILTISETNYNEMNDSILNLPRPTSKEDKGYYVSSIETLDFIRKWLNHDNIEILCISDIA